MENAYVGFASVGLAVGILRRPWDYGGQVGIDACPGAEGAREG